MHIPRLKRRQRPLVPLLALLAGAACCAAQQQRVAIIGAGIGGSSTAYFLSQWPQPPDVIRV